MASEWQRAQAGFFYIRMTQSVLKLPYKPHEGVVRVLFYIIWMTH